MLRLRQATDADREQLLEWRNEPTTRAASRRTELVTPEEHAGWLAGVLADPDRHLLIAELDHHPVGQVRFDRRRAYDYEISISLDPARRGRQLAAPLIEAGCEWLWTKTNAASVEAGVRVDNERSARAFLAAGFRPLPHEGDGFRRLRLERPDPWAPGLPGAQRGGVSGEE